MLIKRGKHVYLYKKKVYELHVHYIRVNVVVIKYEDIKDVS